MSVGLWASGEWREQAVAWIDERLAAAGLERTGPAEQPRVRPWATLLTAPTSGGKVWFKAGGRRTAFEAGLYELLARVVPERVLRPIATDAGRGWMLLPDGGPPVGTREGLAEALGPYGRLQRALAPHVDEMVALGVADMRPAAMPARFEEALELTRAQRVAQMRCAVAEWAERLAASPVPASIDHNDLHPYNVIAGARFYDWGDAVLAHPFASMLVPLDLLGGDTAARDAYLAQFGDLAPHAELLQTLEAATRLAVIARALVWERALSSAREQGEVVSEAWEGAAAATLESLLGEEAQD
jgi:Phosphotransferase enzyme family